MLYLSLQVYYSKRIQISQPKEETCNTGPGLGGLNVKVPSASGMCYPPSTSIGDSIEYCHLGCSPELWCLEFLQGFHCISMNDFVTVHVAHFLQISYFPEVRLISHGSKGQHSNYMFDLFGVNSPHLYYLFSLNHLGTHCESPY